MTRRLRLAALGGCIVASTALPAFGQAQPAAPAAAAPTAPSVAKTEAAPKAGGTETSAVDATETARPLSPPAPPPPPPRVPTKTDDAKRKLAELRQQIEAWYGSLRSAPPPAPDQTDQTLLAALQAIDEVQEELEQDPSRRRRGAFNRLSSALQDLRAAAEARDQAATQETPGATNAREPIGPTPQAIEEANVSAQDEKPRPAATAGRKVTLQDGSDFNYGLTISLFRLSVARLADEPARIRNYSPRFEALPAEFGFQFTYRPSGAPWRLRTASKEGFQLMSVGGILLARVDNDHFSQGEVGLAGTLQFLEDSVGLGLGFDLYRGVPVQGPDGQRGESTAYTGPFSWAFARDGEITPENVFVLLTVNVAGLAGKISTKGSEQ